MLDELQLPMADFSAVYTADNGQQYECFHLNRELTETLLTGYSIPLRHKVILRWRELEAGAAASTVTLSEDPRISRIAQALNSGLIDKAEAARLTAAILAADQPKVAAQATAPIALPAPRKVWRHAEPSGESVFGITAHHAFNFHEVYHYVKGGQRELDRVMREGGFVSEHGHPTPKGMALFVNGGRGRVRQVWLKEMLVAIGAWPTRK